MKNITWVFIVCMMLNMSCKKNGVGQIENGTELRNVMFSTSGFIQQHSGLATNSTLTTNAVLNGDEGTVTKALQYLVYDGNGKLFRKIAQKQTDAGFGVISDKLPVGTYTVCFVGGEDYYPVKNPNAIDNPMNAIFQVSNNGNFNTASASYSNNDVRDIWFKKITLTVSTQDVNQNILLDRVGGQLEVNIKDAIPNNVIMINIEVEGGSDPTGGGAYSFSFTKGVSSFDPQQPSGRIYWIDASLRGTANNTLTMPILNTTENFKVTVTAYSVYSQTKATTVATKIISNVMCKPNKRTILSGNMFGGLATTGGLTIGADNTWNITPITVSF